MNPFLQSTVATPQPKSRWGGPARRPQKGRAGGEPDASGQPPPSSNPRDRTSGALQHPGSTSAPHPGSTSAQHSGSTSAPQHGPGNEFSTLRRAGRFFGAVTLMGCLFIPGMAMAIDINSATAQELQTVKGIGPKMAQVIIDERQRGGRFESMADISERVKGVGPKKAASFEAAGLTVGAATAAASANSAKAAAGAGGPTRRNR